MARPQKNGLEYFPLDVDMDQDDKIALVEARHGIAGFAIVVKLFMKVYKNGYFYAWTEKEQLLFSRRVNVDINAVSAVINDCLKWGLFDQAMYDAYQLLTSKGIQQRYLRATDRRRNVQIERDYLLINDEEVNVYKNLVIVDRNSPSTGINADTCLHDVGNNFLSMGVNEDACAHDADRNDLSAGVCDDMCEHELEESFPSPASSQEKTSDETVDETPEEAVAAEKQVVPYAKIQELYNTTCVSYPRVRGIKGKRQQHVRARWSEFGDLETFQQVFEKAEGSLFMRGQNNKNWTANFDWMMLPTNFLKILEGRYDERNQRAVKPAQPASLAGFAMAET